MASFAKHLSTHLYFHMERPKSDSRNSQGGASGFSRIDPPHTPSTHRSRSWNTENSRSDVEQRGYSSYGGELVPTYDDVVVRDSSRREHRGSIMGNDWPEDYFSYSPYLLTPDMSAKSRTRRRYNRRYSESGGRFEISINDETEEYYHVVREYPRTRPPEPASPILDRRFLPATPQRRSGRGEVIYPSVHPAELEQDCFIVPSHMRGRFLPIKSVSFILYSFS
ncbi:uncharacterized protein TNCV_2213831 [Trichonephila clavipes]|nr:uncharacterized protein TNCV_2213831 [Trichonephila clavipes]